MVSASMAMTSMCSIKGLSTREVSGERACNSAYACRDGKMLKTNQMRGRVAKAVCVDLQAVGFFGELCSLAKGFGPFLRGFGQALEKGRFYF